MNVYYILHLYITVYSKPSECVKIFTFFPENACKKWEKPTQAPLCVCVYEKYYWTCTTKDHTLYSIQTCMRLVQVGFLIKVITQNICMRYLKSILHSRITDEFRMLKKKANHFSLLNILVWLLDEGQIIIITPFSMLLSPINVQFSISLFYASSISR